MSIAFTTVPSNAVASGVFIEQEAVLGSFGSLLIPQKIALFGQYNNGKSPEDYVPRQVSGPDEVASITGNGSMLHLMAVKAFLQNQGVPVYIIPLPAHVSGVAAQGSITASGTCTGAGNIALFVAGQRVAVAIALGDNATTVATKIATRIAALVKLPVTETHSSAVVTLTAKWKGVTGNDINLAVDLDANDDLDEPLGIALSLSQMTGGLNNPDATSAFDGLGNSFFTQVAFPYTDSANLTLLDAYWEARIAASVKKPFIAIIGNVEARATYQSTVQGRNSPAETYCNVQVSPNLPLEIAAAAVAACSASASSDVARPWKNLKLRGIRAGVLPEFTWEEHNNVQLAGGGTTVPMADGTVIIKDLVTTSKTNELGAEDDTLRYPETIANYQAKVYSLDAMFNLPPFDRAIVIPDGTPSSKQYVVSPGRVISYLRRLVRELWIANQWSHTEAAIFASMEAEINASNPGRIDCKLTDLVSSGLRIVAMKYEWAFAANQS